MSSLLRLLRTTHMHYPTTTSTLRTHIHSHDHIHLYAAATNSVNIPSLTTPPTLISLSSLASLPHIRCFASSPTNTADATSSTATHTHSNTTTTSSQSQSITSQHSSKQRNNNSNSKRQRKPKPVFPRVSNQPPPSTTAAAHSRLPPELGGKRIVTYVGKVVSTKAEKTINVEVDRWFKLAKYDRMLRHTKKFMTHDEHEEANEGDIVEIRAYRPISKRKFHVLNKILHRRPLIDQHPTDPNAERRQTIEKVQLGKAKFEEISYP